MEHTILVADDDEGVLKFTEMILESKGYKTISAPNGQKAWELYQQYKKEGKTISAIITDRQMPVLDGYGLATKIKEADPCVPIIMLSGGMSNDDKDKAISLGIDYCLDKSIDEDVLCAVLEARLK